MMITLQKVTVPRRYLKINKITMLKIKYTKSDLKRKFSDSAGEDKRRNDRSSKSSSGSPSSSDREDLLSTINEPLFAEFFAKKRKIDSMETQSSSSSSGFQELSRENSPWGNSPTENSTKNRRQNVDSSSSSTSDTEESINNESLRQKRYEFQTILDSLSKRKFSKGTSISSSSSHNSSKSIKKIKPLPNRRRFKNVPKNPTQNMGKSFPQFNENLQQNNNQGLDLLHFNSSDCSNYKNGVISPSTSLDGYKRENGSTTSGSITSNSSVNSFEEFQQDNSRAKNSTSTSIHSSSPSANSSSSSNNQDGLHDNSSSSEDSDTNGYQNNLNNKRVKINRNNTSLDGRSPHALGSYANVRPHMYLIAPDGYTRYTPYTNYKWERSMYPNLETGSHQNDTNLMEYVRFQPPTSDTGWLGQNEDWQEIGQLSQRNPHDLYKSVQNNINHFKNNFSNVEEQTTEWTSHYSQAQSHEINMERYYKDQNTIPMENFEQRAEYQTALQQENQDIMQMNWQTMSFGANTHVESDVWSDVMNTRVDNNSSSVRQYQDMEEQYLSKHTNDSLQNNTTHQYQNMYQSMSQQNVQVASTLQQEESCTEGQTNANSNNEGKGKDPKSQMAFIALAIMSHPEYKMTLSEIYHHIENKHPRYLRRPDWRNGVRHTLSHNACFIKVEKAVHRPRKGHYWSIHPACIQEFSEGKFCLRRSKRLIMAYTNPSFPSEVPQLDVLKDFNEANVE